MSTTASTAAPAMDALIQRRIRQDGRYGQA